MMDGMTSPGVYGHKLINMFYCKDIFGCESQQFKCNRAVASSMVCVSPSWDNSLRFPSKSQSDRLPLLTVKTCFYASSYSFGFTAQRLQCPSPPPPHQCSPQVRFVGNTVGGGVYFPRRSQRTLSTDRREYCRALVLKRLKKTLSTVRRILAGRRELAPTIPKRDRGKQTGIRKGRS